MPVVSVDSATELACIVAEPVTLPEPSKEAEVQTTSPVIPIVLPAAKAVAVVAFPDTAPVNCVAARIPELGLYVNPVSVSIPCVPVAPSTKAG